MTLLLLSLCLAAPPQAPRPPQGPVALATPERKPVHVPAVEYGVARAEALWRNLPLVIWVGTPAERFAGAVHIELAEFPGVAGTGIVVGVPDGAADLDRHDYSCHDVAAVRRRALVLSTPLAPPRFFFRAFSGTTNCGPSG